MRGFFFSVGPRPSGGGGASAPALGPLWALASLLPCQTALCLSSSSCARGRRGGSCAVEGWGQWCVGTCACVCGFFVVLSLRNNLKSGPPPLPDCTAIGREDSVQQQLQALDDGIWGKYAAKVIERWAAACGWSAGGQRRGDVCGKLARRGSFLGGVLIFFLCVLCTLPSYCQPSLAAEVLEYHVACQFHGLALDVYLVLDGDERHETRPVAPSRSAAAKTAYENAKKSPTRGRCRPHTTHALAPPYVDSCAGLCLWCGLRAAGCGGVTMCEG